MKQVLIAVLTLVVVLAFCIFTCGNVRSAAATSLSALRLAQVQSERGDFTNAADAVLAASQNWKAHERFFDVVLRHSEVDEISTVFSSLYQYALARDADDFAAQCAEMIARIQHIRQMQLPTASNIF